MIKEIKKEISKIIIGQEDVIENLIISTLVEGHTLIIGAPGLAKTLLVNAIGRVLGLSFSRIQFTPDLMPTDITGTEIIQELETKEKVFRFIKGPVFSNIVLADEINRAPPKTQSALLEAMQERKVTYAGKNYPLEEPFIVIATQNPIEQEGTYPLPEAQLDRFMFSINITYPRREEEKMIIARGIISDVSELKVISNKKEILKMKKEIESIPVSEEIIELVMQLVNDTRPESTSIQEVKKYVEWGVSPRGGQYLLLGAKARTFISGRPTPSYDDVLKTLPLVFSHRIILNFLANAEGVKVNDIIDLIIKNVRSVKR
uniref:AAA family ATPase n=1 Tax=candidate division WOR-3 bacterium TaxID=2052148 RepID=A0A7C4UFK2_UNCW3